MNHQQDGRNLYDFKKILIMVTAVSVGSIFGGYHAYNAWHGSVRNAVYVGGVTLVIGLFIIGFVVYRGNKKGKN